MTDEQYFELKRDIRKVESMVMDIYDKVIDKKKICPICQNEVRIYLPYGNMLRYNAQCPVCRSLERHRALWLFLQNNKELFDKGGSLLHFAPEGAFWNYFNSLNTIDYWPVDIDDKVPGIRKVVDITDIPFEDESFDMIICNHVLEHIVDEKKALSELHRVLKRDGIAILNVPIDNRLERTLEDISYNTTELRVKYYGQADHVRMYGRDYIEHLKSALFSVKVVEPNLDYTEEQLRNYGLFAHEQIYLCN